MRNKILIISFIFILLSLVLVNNCFAYNYSNLEWYDKHYITYDIENDKYKLFFEDKEYDLSIKKENSNIFIIRDFGSSATVYHFNFSENAKYYFYLGNGDDNNLYFTCTEDYTIVSYTDYYNGTISDVSTNNFNANSTKSFSKYYDWYILSPYITGIYTDSSCTDFFFKTPVMETEKTTLAEVLEAANPTEVFKNLMKNVVVSLIVFLVGFLTFSKAWAWLKTQLSKA